MAAGQTTPWLELQKDIYAALTGDVTLMSKITGVFDFVKDNQPYAYVSIGDAEWNDFGTQTFDGFRGTYTIHTWHQTGTRGRAPVFDIMNDIYRILHENNFSIPNFDVMVSRYDFSEVLVEEDRVTYHGVTRFRILIGGNYS